MELMKRETKSLSVFLYYSQFQHIEKEFNKSLLLLFRYVNNLRANIVESIVYKETK